MARHEITRYLSFAPESGGSMLLGALRSFLRGDHMVPRQAWDTFRRLPHEAYARADRLFPELAPVASDDEVLAALLAAAGGAGVAQFGAILQALHGVLEPEEVHEGLLSEEGLARLRDLCGLPLARDMAASETSIISADATLFDGLFSGILMRLAGAAGSAVEEGLARLRELCGLPLSGH